MEHWHSKNYIFRAQVLQLIFLPLLIQFVASFFFFLFPPLRLTPHPQNPISPFPNWWILFALKQQHQTPLLKDHSITAVRNIPSLEQNKNHQGSSLLPYPPPKKNPEEWAWDFFKWKIFVWPNWNYGEALSSSIFSQINENKKSYKGHGHHPTSLQQVSKPSNK